jgi:hypothetical protein
MLCMHTVRKVDDLHELFNVKVICVNLFVGSIRFSFSSNFVPSSKHYWLNIWVTLLSVLCKYYKKDWSKIKSVYFFNIENIEI